MTARRVLVVIACAALAFGAGAAVGAVASGVYEIVGAALAGTVVGFLMMSALR